jgi:hypothetical protein
MHVHTYTQPCIFIHRLRTDPRQNVGWCADNGGSWAVYDYQLAIETKYLKAIAEAYAYAFASNPPNKCKAAAAAVAET